MITEKYEIQDIVTMFDPTELKVLPIVANKEDCRIPAAYMLYGEPIDKYSLALTALRFVCDEITRRTYNGRVLPRVIVSVADLDGLIIRCPDGEVCDLLDIIAAQGEQCGVELSA